MASAKDVVSKAPRCVCERALKVDNMVRTCQMNIRVGQGRHDGWG